MYIKIEGIEDLCLKIKCKASILLRISWLSVTIRCIEISSSIATLISDEHSFENKYKHRIFLRDSDQWIDSLNNIDLT